MEDGSRKTKNRSYGGTGDVGFTSSERVRTRWTPKPEQILILESIFNSGMVNPPKDDTVRIRKLLERFGSVGDANVFYWFQNRRSRSRRRQRQLQAEALSGSNGGIGVSPPLANYLPTNPSPANFFSSSAFRVPTIAERSSNLFENDSAEDLFAISRQMGFAGTARPPPRHNDTWSRINGAQHEMPSGPFDGRSLYGHDALLHHPSGEIVQLNDAGISFRALRDGESYILI